MRPVDTERITEIIVSESAPYRLKPFLADLALVMRSTAETARLRAIRECREDARTCVEQIKARKDDEADNLRGAAEASVVTIRESSQAQVEQVRAQADELIGRRRERLEQELAECNSVVELEVQRVQERVAAFQDETTRFFERLLQNDVDPAAIAAMASKMPSPPNFDAGLEPRASEADEPDRREAGQPPAGSASADAPAQSAVALPASSCAPLAPGRLSGAGAVRGRLVSEWYGEVERLKETGDENAAVGLLLDMLTGTEAESVADGSYVATRPYQELVAIYSVHARVEAEYSILERFSRQQHAPGAASSKLLERKAAIKKAAKR